jgi:NAD(P)-dependent dehydrogenase (short-subunit alcohol dehydrogenase family)
MELSGAAALVTGGGRGLGAAVAVALEEIGMHVAVADLETILAREEYPPTALPCAVDVTDEGSVHAALHATQRLGPLRVLVNCAGVVLPGSFTPSGPANLIENVRREIEVNLLGTLRVVHAAVPYMARAKPIDGERGVIVNTSSVAAFDGQVGQVGYSASKAGIAGATLPLARELARHLIRVVSIAPGMFETPMLHGLPAKTLASLHNQVPHPSRAGRPREFAELVVAIARNAMLNGEVVRLDGALRMSAR